MKIMTWNINSVRLREQSVLKVMQDYGPDIICLQETKTPDEHFPQDNFKALGYNHIHINGMKSYNGVCVISKVPFKETEIHNRVGREDCRHIGVQFKDFDLHNLYIPAGGDEPDPDVNDKYAHKLDFVDEMTRWFADRYSNDNPVVTLGDFNIAPLEHYVWSSKQLKKVVSHTPPERERLEKMKNSIGWSDAVRHFVPEEEKCYSWWSYRNRDWKKSNRGRRLDHIWVTEPLKTKLKSHSILTETRDWEKPSDHVPVMIELDL
ncbi:MAG: exodeoxyribonuclease III [Pseudomonadota bacterium]